LETTGTLAIGDFLMSLTMSGKWENYATGLT
jgi:hypothetical protein